MTDVFGRIRSWLTENGADFRHVNHPPTLTSEESARARGEPLRIGGKALVVKVDETFRLFVLPADRKFDSSRAKQYFSAKKTRFASAEELLALTGLVPGSVPPFGRPILDLDLHADPAVLANERIAFNAGSLTDSIVMTTADWRRLAQPTLFEFAQ